MSKLINTVVVIVVSLAAGYLARLYVLRYDPTDGPRKVGVAAAKLQRIVMLFFMPLMLVNTFWGLRLSGGTLVLFPLIGVFSHGISGAAAFAATRLLKHAPRQAGAMFNCGTFTNITSFGGLTAFMFYGEAGYALSALFKLFEPLIYFTIGFPLAKMYAEGAGGGAGGAGNGGRLRIDLRVLLRDIMVMLPVLGIAFGALLNWSGIVRPAVFGRMMEPFVMVATALMLISIGLNMKIAPGGGYRREILAILAIKNVIVPGAMLLTGLALGYGRMEGGMPLRVLVTMGAMPVAMKSLVAVSLYKLDTDLANLLWLASTIAFIAVLPLMYLLTVI